MKRRVLLYLLCPLVLLTLTILAVASGFISGDLVNIGRCAPYSFKWLQPTTPPGATVNIDGTDHLSNVPSNQILAETLFPTGNRFAGPCGGVLRLCTTWPIPLP